MSAHHLQPTLNLDLPLPGRTPSAPLEALLSASGKAYMALRDQDLSFPDPSTLRGKIDEAQAFLAACTAQHALLQDAVEHVPDDEVGRQLIAFTAAWPNASSADLTGYGVQLADDVLDRRPCHYALREALRHLRQTSRFLPSIAEVLASLDKVQKRVRATAWHIGQLPGEIEKARAALSEIERRAAARSEVVS